MKNTHLIITSIADSNNKILKSYAKKCLELNIPFLVIGDNKSPNDFELPGCKFYSISEQKKLDFSLAKILPDNHYCRKNLGYLLAVSKGAEIIIETDDDNLPLENFWIERERSQKAFTLKDESWVNIYGYYSELNIWPRGFSLEHLHNKLPELKVLENILCPIQQGLADENPDVDAIYRLTLPLPVTFKQYDNIALKDGTICPFNSQNTTWFKEAFALMYLPSFCSFRMTDIWRSFVAQRIAWTCGWPILYHSSTVKQDRNEHNLMKDFSEEIVGYVNNRKIVDWLLNLNLRKGVDQIPYNMIVCYEKLIAEGIIEKEEMTLLIAWLKDIQSIK